MRTFVMGSANLQIRVNGILITKLTLRREMKSGYPDGPYQVVITDPVLGPFAINDTFEIELKEGRGKWRKVFANELLTTLNAIGTTP